MKPSGTEPENSSVLRMQRVHKAPHLGPEGVEQVAGTLPNPQGRRFQGASEDPRTRLHLKGNKEEDQWDTGLALSRGPL
eukprot:14978554-Alexandrium_andersonii.AAC.1